MFNQLLKITLFTSIWFWLKPRWRALLALTVFVLLVTILHGEYLNFVKISGDTHWLFASYAIKWLLLVTGIGAFIVVSGSGRHNGAAAATSRESSRNAGSRQQADVDDGFDFLRNKKELKNRAEKLLDE